MVPPTPAESAPPPADDAAAVTEAARRQARYAAQRRAWAERVGRPYEADVDARPPPGELDAADEE